MKLPSVNWFQTEITCILKWVCNSVLWKEVYMRTNSLEITACVMHCFLQFKSWVYSSDIFCCYFLNVFQNGSPWHCESVLIKNGGGNGLIMFTTLYCCFPFPFFFLREFAKEADLQVSSSDALELGSWRCHKLQLISFQKFCKPFSPSSNLIV